MTVASTSTASPTIPIAVIIGGTAGDHGWWAEQAAQNGTDWAGVLDGARELLAVAVGEVSSMDDTFERACREADRKAAARPVDAKTLRARCLLADDDISYERAYYEILRDRPASEATIDALVYSLRRGVNELTRPDAKRRPSELSEDQLRAVCERLRNFKPEIARAWTPEEVEALTIIWSELK
jgi:transposase